MQIHLISIGNKMPDWVVRGYEEYARRLPRECELKLREIAPGKRLKNADVSRLVKDEGERMLAALPNNAHTVALDLKGKPWSTAELSEALTGWQAGGRNVALLVGGPEGLAQAVRQKADETWSLSNLTFPHPLVRIIVAEQIYRAWSLMRNHPYHR
ncbi:MAG: 23S rRNA (pseudouridine(1915)-N(3))-methyltransferase RlmH [Gammaproteobacteria bacterium]